MLTIIIFLITRQTENTIPIDSNLTYLLYCNLIILWNLNRILGNFLIVGIVLNKYISKILVYFINDNNN
jgi:hypothetical protein